MKIVFLILISMAFAASASEPPANSIPIIGQRLGWWYWTPEMLCELAWNYFTGFELESYIGDTVRPLMDSCATMGLDVIVTPGDLLSMGKLGEHSRAHIGSLSGQNAFFQTDENGGTIEEYYAASAMQTELSETIGDILADFGVHDVALWC